MRRAPALLAACLLAGMAAATPTSVARGSAPVDPVAAEIQRWSDYVRTNTASDGLWMQARQGAEPLLTAAEQALKDGRRLLAIQRLAAARELLAAAQYVAQQPARGDAAAFEAEWTSSGKLLASGVSAARASGLEEVRPAALRALAEVALAQVKAYHDASLEYGRNTMPESGFFYLGTARAQLGLAELLRSFSGGAAGRAIPARRLQRELDALEAELLGAYRPPAAIDRHREFITASAALKEARELDAAGQRHGALLRYLQAAQRLAPLRSPALVAPDAAAIARTLEGWEAKLSKGDTDHTIGRLFIEEAQAALAAPSGVNPASPAIIANDLLPRYVAALEAEAPAPVRPAAAVTVTLVRWPYT